MEPVPLAEPPDTDSSTAYDKPRRMPLATPAPLPTVAQPELKLQAERLRAAASRTDSLVTAMLIYSRHSPLDLRVLIDLIDIAKTYSAHTFSRAARLVADIQVHSE